MGKTSPLYRDQNRIIRVCVTVRFEYHLITWDRRENRIPVSTEYQSMAEGSVRAETDPKSAKG